MRCLWFFQVRSYNIVLCYFIVGRAHYFLFAIKSKDSEMIMKNNNNISANMPLSRIIDKTRWTIYTRKQLSVIRYLKRDCDYRRMEVERVRVAARHGIRPARKRSSRKRDPACLNSYFSLLLIILFFVWLYMFSCSFSFSMSFPMSFSISTTILSQLFHEKARVNNSTQYLYINISLGEYLPIPLSLSLSLSLLLLV